MYEAYNNKWYLAGTYSVYVLYSTDIFTISSVGRLEISKLIYTQDYIVFIG